MVEPIRQLERLHVHLIATVDRETRVDEIAGPPHTAAPTSSPDPHGGGNVETTTRPSPTKARLVYETASGSMYTGLAEHALARPPLTKHRGRVQMLFTS